ncbi:MAG: DUF4097 family beta strand repeat protein [Anaerolineae bacterium]|nr:DUF4097 family beta strand repeat protein [Anaerolineae bacterium]
MSDVYEPKVKYVPSEPKPRQSGFLRGCLLLGCAAMFLCCFSAFGLGAGVAALGATVDANEQKAVKNERLVINSDEVNLVVENYVGKVKISGSRSAEDIQVTLELKATGMTEDRARTRLDSIRYEVERDGDTYRVWAREDENTGFWDKIGNSSVDMTINVPEELNITVTSNVGEIDINNVIIRDKLDVTTEVGGVKFSGQIGPEGDHSITTNVGAVKVRVTRDSSFRLDAKSNVGDVNADLDLNNEQNSQEVVSRQVSGDYGNDPEATLTIISDVGEIEIRD